MEPFLFKTRTEAQIILDQLKEILNLDRVVYLKDLKALTGLPTAYLDDQTGWTSLRDAKITKVDTKYQLELPPVKKLS